jgi:hypothetical protein
VSAGAQSLRHFFVLGAEKSVAEANRAHQLDPLTPAISANVGYVHIYAPTIRRGHCCMQEAGKSEPNIRQSVRVFTELRVGVNTRTRRSSKNGRPYGKLSGGRDESGFASALEPVFRSAGWNGLSAKPLKSGKRNSASSYRFQRLKVFMPAQFRSVSRSTPGWASGYRFNLC